MIRAHFSIGQRNHDLLTLRSGATWPRSVFMSTNLSPLHPRCLAGVYSMFVLVSGFAHFCQRDL